MPREKDDKPATVVFDRGRRGEPIMGCDCVQCFGYCCADREIANREAREGFYQGLMKTAHTQCGATS